MMTFFSFNLENLSLPKMRLTGMLVGMKEVFPHLEHCPVTHLDGDGKFGPSFEAMRRHLRYSKSRRSLVAAHPHRRAAAGRAGTAVLFTDGRRGAEPPIQMR